MDEGFSNSKKSNQDTDSEDNGVERNSLQDLLTLAVKENDEIKIMKILNLKRRAHESFKDLSDSGNYFREQMDTLRASPEFLLDLEYRYENNKTLYMIAAENNMPDVWTFLKKQGANIRAKDGQGRSVAQYFTESLLSEAEKLRKKFNFDHAQDSEIHVDSNKGMGRNPFAFYTDSMFNGRNSSTAAPSSVPQAGASKKLPLIVEFPDDSDASNALKNT